MIFDTHAHYDDEAFDNDREAVLESLQENGIGYVVNVGASMKGARESVRLASRYPFVYAAVGIHPDEVGCLNDERMEELRSLCRLEKTVAVGEIGLDYYWDREPRQVQKRWFAEQLQLAKEMDLPVNVHSRDAAQDTMDVIRAEHAGITGGVIHCYSGSVEMAREYVRMGYFLGIGGVITFKNSRVLKEVVREIPLEHLVTETDCPYLAPAPHRGTRNDSRNLPLVAEAIARIKELPLQQAEEILFENAKRLYRL
ncbi:MAG: TatD family hydrolase [Lachnospiraceae bacterium]|nr:TatD family hydrolase [Lachnospiraceae bacterium]